MKLNTINLVIVFGVICMLLISYMVVASVYYAKGNNQGFIEGKGWQGAKDYNQIQELNKAFNRLNK